MSGCSCHQHDQHEHDHHGGDGGFHARETWSLALSGVLIVSGLVLRALGIGPALLAPLVFGAAVIAGGWMLVPSAWSALRRVRPNISLLMVTACIGAAGIGEWAEAAIVVFLFGVAEWLEGWADRRAHRAVRALLDLAPPQASVRRDGKQVEVAVEEVSVGENVSVKNGMRIPLDGRVVGGCSTVDQAPITGESIPVEKEVGDEVFAGSINGDGALEIEVTKPAGNSTLARIIRLVEEAQENRAPTQRFVDVFARYYTPAVAIGAVLVFLIPPLLQLGPWSVWAYRACALLIIACPCALVISTPVSIVAGLTALARRGVLVKGGAHLEALGQLRAVAVDKTGTITLGRPRVHEVLSVADASERDVARIAAAIDANSTHPVARAVVDYAIEHQIADGGARDHQTSSGRGAAASIDGHRYFVGNHRFTHELGVCSTQLERQLDEMENRGRSVVVVGHQPHDDCAGEVLGVLAVGDTVRPDTREAVAMLHRVGVRHVVMLSGDNSRTAHAIAEEVGIDDVRGNLLPEDKVRAVRELRERYGTVAMVGDGVNDAPALASATIGIAMGAAGTDTAIETADVALMNDQLGRVAEAVALGRRTLGIIRFNIGFALALKALFLALAVLGYTSLWLAILADTGATLLVVANALRLLRHEPNS